MYKQKKILAVIPARGGSKGLPGKNIKRICGKPLIAWAIASARKSNYIDKIIVSTDDLTIARVSKKFKAEVPFLRPKELATDKASVTDVVLHLLNWLEKQGNHYDYLCLLEPTSPLRKKDDLDRAIKHLIDNEPKGDSLVSIGEIALEHPSIVKKKQGIYAVPFIKSNKPKSSRRQDLDKAYFPYGVIYLVKTSSLKKEKSFYTKKNIYYEIERWQNYEINDIYDFICIESIMKKNIGELK